MANRLPLLGRQRRASGQPRTYAESQETAAKLEGDKELYKEAGKAQGAQIAEIQKEGKTSAQAINAINLIRDTVKNFSPEMGTGPAAPIWLKKSQIPA
jgi:hypothetical protein